MFPGLALSALYRDRATPQRKHFLRALAVEAGFPDWEIFRPQLDLMSPEEIGREMGLLPSVFGVESEVWRRQRQKVMTRIESG